MTVINKISAIALSIVLLVFMFGCTTFMGPTNFVEYKIDKGLKKSEQSSLYENSFDKYFEDEYTYDDKGNVIKVKSTVYFDKESAKDRKYIVYETEWVVIGDNVLPSKVSCNGEVYCEIQWDIMDSKNKGSITQDIYSKFYIQKDQVLTSVSYKRWYADLDDYPIPFLSDGKFIKNIKGYTVFYQYTEKNVLTLGYDNIVLKRYFYSYDKLRQGQAKTYPAGSLKNTLIASLSKNSDVEFNYDWNVVADKLCLNKILFTAKFPDRLESSKFEIGIKYNEKGQRTEEEWTVIEPDNKDKRTTVFKQTLQY